MASKQGYSTFCLHIFIFSLVCLLSLPCLADTKYRKEIRRFDSCMLEEYKKFFRYFISLDQKKLFPEDLYFSALGQIYRRADFTDAARLFEPNFLKAAHGRCVPKSDLMEQIFKEKNSELLRRLYSDLTSLPERFVLNDDSGRQFENEQKAFELFNRAAGLGDIESQEELAEMYWHGLGTPKNHIKAIQALLVASRNGSVRAQGTLGLRYAGFPGGFMWIGDEPGFEPNYLLAYVWLNVSAAGGHSYAVKWRGEVVKKLTNKQVEDAQSISEKCFSSKFQECPG